MNQDSKVPALRTDIAGEVFKQDDEELIMLYDPNGYALEPVPLPVDLVPFLQMLNGELTFVQFDAMIRQAIEGDAQQFIDYFKEILKMLDFYGYLDTPRFQWLKQDIENYKSSDIRPPVCAGNSYPNNKTETDKELDKIFASFNKDDVKPGADMIIVPHIDFRIGTAAHKTYASGYHALRNTNPDLVVIFGTSHYGMSGLFMLTDKHFDTPLGLAVTDVEIASSLKDYENDAVVFDDFAHRNEHSIELQVVLAQHYFNNPNIAILPVLVGSFHEFVNKKELPDKDSKIELFLNTLNELIKKSGKKAVYITSVDMAHIGRKFGDEFDAEDMLEVVRLEDEKLIHHMANCDADSYFMDVANIEDKYKICGLSPVYSMLKMRKPIESRFLEYHQWSEKETKSAVTFSSLAFY